MTVGQLIKALSLVDPGRQVRAYLDSEAPRSRILLTIKEVEPASIVYPEGAVYIVVQR